MRSAAGALGGSLLLMALGAWVGCAKEPPLQASDSAEASPKPNHSAPTATPAASSSAAEGAPTVVRSARAGDPTPDPITHPCVVKAAQFDIELAKNESSCATDADCDCFPGGITMRGGCGGVRSKASAQKLQALSRELEAMKCEPEKVCAPATCAPKCNAGTCG